VGIGFSIFLFVIGAILTFAVDVSTFGGLTIPDGVRTHKAT
jgi:hypothetical protein